MLHECNSQYIIAILVSRYCNQVDQDLVYLTYPLPTTLRLLSLSLSTNTSTNYNSHVARMGESRGVFRVLVGKSEGKRQLGRPRHIWEDNIKMELQEVRCGCMDWIELAQVRDRWRAFVKEVMNLPVP